MRPSRSLHEEKQQIAYLRPYDFCWLMNIQLFEKKIKTIIVILMQLQDIQSVLC